MSSRVTLAKLAHTRQTAFLFSRGELIEGKDTELAMPRFVA